MAQVIVSWMDTRRFTQSDRNLAFHRSDAAFNYRVAAIFQLDGHVLLHRARTDDYWALPGGRPHHFESAPAALRREMLEEFGELVEVGNLAAVIEVVFATTHEINLCFEAELPTVSRLRDVTIVHGGEEAGVPLIFKWLPVDGLDKERILPRPVPPTIIGMANGCDYWFDDERRTTEHRPNERE